MSAPTLICRCKAFKSVPFRSPPLAWLQIAPGMSVPAFLAAAEPLIAPLDAYFDKVFVMCDDEVS